MGPYETFLLGLMPPPLRRATATKLVGSIGASLDAYIEAGQAALRAGHVETTPDDGVEHHARARLLERIPWETLSQLRERVVGAWDFWVTLHRRRSGATPSGLEAMLRSHLGIDTVVVYDQANDGWLNGAQVTPFGDDDNTDDASRQVIIIPRPHPFEEPEVGDDLEVGPETLVGITMTVSFQSRIRGLYRKHRPANLVGIDIWVIFDGTPAEDLVLYHDATNQVIRLPIQCSMVGYEGGGAVHQMQVGDNMIVGREFT